MVRRRTHPGFLSDDEAARDRRRIEQMVRSITGVNRTEGRKEDTLPMLPIMEDSKKQAKQIIFNQSFGRKIVAKPVRWTEIERVGETDDFIVEFSGAKRLVIIYGKELPWGSPFKLRLTLIQVGAVLMMLEKARHMIWGTEDLRVGEQSGVVLDYDDGLLMLHRKEVQASCQFKLALDKSETLRMLDLLNNAKNFFS